MRPKASLTEYKKIRDFETTPGQKAKVKKLGNRIFVIQEHHATHLHWDILRHTSLDLFLILLFSSSLFAQWEPERRLAFNDSTSSTSSYNNRFIAASGDTVHVVWYDLRDGEKEIFYKRSTDGGNTWGSDVRLTKSLVLSSDPSIASMGPDVHVAWVNLWKGNYEIFYKRSTDGGTTWGPDTPLTKDTLASVEPSIAVSGANIFVVWKYVLQRDRSDIAKGGIEYIARGPRGICYRRSTDKGTTWDSKVLLSGKPIFAEYPSVGVSGVNVHVVWNDLHDNPKYLSFNECLIYYKHSSDGGRTWRPETCLTTFPSPATHPSIAVSGSNIHVVWEDKRERDENTEIYYKHSDDGGLTWCQDVRLMNYINPSNRPSIAVTGAKLHFVWLIALSNIYYSHSADGGMNWKSVTNLTGQNSYAKQPSVAISGSKVHLVWCDHRDGNWEIYYKRNPTGNK